MKILHLVNSIKPHLNDDEGSITHALRRLGHEVHNIAEFKAEKFSKRMYDMTLWHHWYDGLDMMPKMPGIKVMWYFDLVRFGELCPEVNNRVEVRNRPIWIKQAQQLCDYTFITDGDWASRYKLHKLTQGADQRIAFNTVAEKEVDVLYVGSTITEDRRSFTKILLKRYGNKFLHVNGLYRMDLARVISKSRVVVCPDTPVTDNYWSNRVYVVTGFGGCVFHPECAGLHKHYNDSEIVYYNNREDLLQKIDKCLEDESYYNISVRGWDRARSDHTYLERCKQMMRMIGDQR